MNKRDKLSLGFIGTVLIILALVIPIPTGSIELYWLGFVIYTIRQSWQEIFLILILFTLVVYAKDIIRLLLLFFQKNLFDHLPRKYHIWGNLSLGTITIVLLFFFISQMYRVSIIRGLYYYKLHRSTYEEHVYQRIQKLEYTGYSQKALTLYQQLLSFASTPEITSQLHAKINQLRISILLSDRYYQLFEQEEEPLTIRRLEWLLMARWLNPEDSRIANSFEQRVNSLEEADKQLSNFWLRAKALDTASVAQLMETYGWYISSYHQPDWFSDKNIVIQALIQEVQASPDSLLFFQHIRQYWNKEQIQQSREYLKHKENGDLVSEEITFDRRAYRRFRMSSDQFALHVVEPGEHITGIAKKYRIRKRRLIDDNLLENPDLIYPTDQILIPIRAFQQFRDEIANTLEESNKRSVPTPYTPYTP